ncbi:MAG: hypothetical protein GYA55_02265, partial [SAR324 cluster bacterium]|nr:hypothetical protein [SAR324 cluster bacterium]
MTMLGQGLFGKAEKAKVDLTMMRIKQVQGLINQYQLRYNQLPSSMSSLMGCDENTGSNCIPIVDSEEELRDAWGTMLIYRNEGGGRSYSLTSLGSDRKVGGSGVERDITVTGP